MLEVTNDCELIFMTNTEQFARKATEELVFLHVKDNMPRGRLGSKIAL